MQLKIKTPHSPRGDRALVTAAEWFARGRRVWYDPESARVLTEEQAAAAPGALRVFERVAAAAATKTVTSTGRSPPPASACPRPRS